MDAVIYSKFPPGIVNNKLIPELAQYGINVTRKCFDFRRVHVKRDELVLVLHEYASHKETQGVKDAADKLNAKVVYLSRKTSGWPEIFKQTGLPATKAASAIEPVVQPVQPTPVAQPMVTEQLGFKQWASSRCAVSDIPGFCKEYIRLYELGHTARDMVPHMQKFWGSPLKNPASIRKFISRRRNLFPKEFLDFLDARKNSKPSAKNTKTSTKPSHWVVSDIPEFCKEYIRLYGMGYTIDDMAPHLQKFWRNPLKNGATIGIWVAFARKKNILPKEFVDFLDARKNIKGRRSINYKKSKNSQEMNASEMPITDKLLVIADGEIASLKAQLAEAQSAIENLKKADLSKLKKTKSLVIDCIENGILTRDAAFEKLCEAIDVY